MLFARRTIILPFLKKLWLALTVGFLAGLAATVFLYLLTFATQTREGMPALFWLLPLFGLTVGVLYARFGGRAAEGPRLILDEIHEPKEIIPARMAPLVLLGTLLTHLGGGSAGREGTAVQMGGSLAEMVSRLFRADPALRREALMAGLGAGFGAAVGAPIAGMIFGLEVTAVGRLRLRGALTVAIASSVAFGTTLLLKAPHTEYPRPGPLPFSFRYVLAAAAAGILFGLAARAFLLLAHGVEESQRRYVRWAPLRPFLGGMLLLLIYFFLGTDRYAGLGLPVIQEALGGKARGADPAWKAVATALTVGSGFKGGEFIPLVFIGSTLGALLAPFFGLPALLAATLGFASVFGAAANVPLACAIMAAELFGLPVFPYALAATYAAYLVSGARSAYPGQRFHRPKAHLLRRALARLRAERRA